MVKDKKLLEKLAALEHEQWIAWANTLIMEEDISPERITRWMEYFVDYSELSEEVKEYDREWARKVIEVINNS